MSSKTNSIAPITSKSFVPSLSEAARSLGCSQAMHSVAGIEYWGGILQQYEEAAKLALVERTELDEECQTHRQAHLNLDSIVMGAGVFEVLHEGSTEAAWKNTTAAVQKLATNDLHGWKLVKRTDRDGKLGIWASQNDETFIWICDL